MTKSRTAAKLRFFDALTVAPELTHLDVHIAWRLLKYTNVGGFAWPSIDRLAREVHCTRRSVLRSVDRLSEDGWFRVISGGGRRRTNRYFPIFGRASSDAGSNGDTLDTVSQDSLETVTPKHHLRDSPDARTVTEGDQDSLTKIRKKPLGAAGCAASAQAASASDALREGDDKDVKWTRREFEEAVGTIKDQNTPIGKALHRAATAKWSSQKKRSRQ